MPTKGFCVDCRRRERFRIWSEGWQSQTSRLLESIDSVRGSQLGFARYFSESGPLEEHLLVCSECQDWVQAEIDFVTAMRAAAAEIRAQEWEPDGVEKSVSGSHHG